MLNGLNLTGILSKEYLNDPIKCVKQMY